MADGQHLMNKKMTHFFRVPNVQKITIIIIPYAKIVSVFLKSYILVRQVLRQLNFGSRFFKNIYLLTTMKNTVDEQWQVYYDTDDA